MTGSPRKIQKEGQENQERAKELRNFPLVTLKSSLFSLSMQNGSIGILVNQKKET